MKNFFTVKEFAMLTGVTERTLRYYDQKGVLTPSHYSDKGHRLYRLGDVHQMQKILTLKYLGFSLQEIIDSISESKTCSIRSSLKSQKELLLKKREEINNIIQVITRVEDLIQDEEINHHLLLLIIHTIQHEQMQEDWLAQHLPAPLLEQIFLRHLSPEEKLEFERNAIRHLQTLQTLHDQGAHPADSNVQNIVLQLSNEVSRVVNVDDFEQLDSLEDPEHLPIQFSFLSKELEQFLEKAFEFLNEQKGENTDDQ